MMYLSH